MFEKLTSLLEEYPFKEKSNSNVAKFRIGNMTTNVGLTRKMLTRDTSINPSVDFIKNEGKIYNECKRIFYDFDFDGVQINKNFKCEPHYDVNNYGDSLVIGLGDYSGGELVVDGLGTFDIFETPVIFDGSKHKHWVNDFQGTRYSIVLFKIKPFITKYCVAIPSYNRALEIKHKTIKTLIDGGVNKSLITIFVANESEKEKYKYLGLKIVVGEKGITKQRNFIKQHYKPNKCVIVIDDDIEEFQTIENGKYKKIENVDELFKRWFETAKKHDVNLFGIYPARNLMFQSNIIEKHGDISKGLLFIIGQCYGLIIEHDQSPYLMNERCKTKQDYEQSILHYIQKGNVLRFNDVSLKTKMYQKGGLGLKPERMEINDKSVNYLLEKYSDFLSERKGKDDYREVRFKQLKKN